MQLTILVMQAGPTAMPSKYPATPRKKRLDYTSRKNFEAPRSQFLRAWISQYYRIEEEADHAENDEREAAELEQLAHMGVRRKWDKKRVRQKAAVTKKKKPIKRTATGPKKH